VTANEPREALRSLKTSELLAELDTLLLEIRRRLDELVAAGRSDIVAADEGFGMAGLVYASTQDASKHARTVRKLLQRLHDQSG